MDGKCIWFTGLSGSGKSTVANELVKQLPFYVTLLDGDIVRTNLSKGLTFSKEDRDTNIQRIGFVAREIVLHGGVVICAAISPYRNTRNSIRASMPTKSFIEVYMRAPLSICEKRDPKGLYAKARAGEIEHFTGISDPYEPPFKTEIQVTEHCTPQKAASTIIKYMRRKL